jgi:hypothetical protein
MTITLPVAPRDRAHPPCVRSLREVAVLWRDVTRGLAVGPRHEPARGRAAPRAGLLDRELSADDAPHPRRSASPRPAAPLPTRPAPTSSTGLLPPDGWDDAELTEREPLGPSPTT